MLISICLFEFRLSIWYTSREAILQPFIKDTSQQLFFKMLFCVKLLLALKLVLGLMHFD